MLRSPMILLSSVLIAAPLYAQAAPSTQAAPATQAVPAPAAAPAAGSGVTAGAAVKDPSGGDVGTIEAVNGTVATLATGTAKAAVPVGSFAVNPDGTLTLALTRAQVEAQVGAATRTAVASTPAGPLKIAVGTKVSDSNGAQVGTVKAVNGDNVTVASATAAAQLPKSAFASGPDGLVIGLSPAQFEAAAKAAGGKTS